MAAVINGGIETANLADSAVTAGKIADTTITAAKMNLSHTTDANGWTVDDHGTFKVYNKRVTFSVSKVMDEYFDAATTNLPVGIASIGTNFLHPDMACNFANDLQHGLKVSSTAATSLVYSARVKVAGPTTFAGWVDFELRTQ